MLLRQIWIFYVTLFIASWLPGTNPLFSSTITTIVSAYSSFFTSSPSRSPSSSSSISAASSSSFKPLKSHVTSHSLERESSSYSPSLIRSLPSSLDIHPIEENSNDITDNQPSSYRRTRFPRSYRNFGLHRVDFNIPANVILGENTTAPLESGPWSPWSEPSRCSRACGGGVRSQKRYCTDTDMMGRSSCVGPDTRYYSCNIETCPEAIDFRAQQCSMFNNQSIPLTIGKLENIEWEPYNSRSNDRRGDDLCALNCKPKNGTWYTRLMERVIDGTKCLREMDWVSGVCVAGNCIPVGCDGLLGSPKVEDKCRVCGGEGKDCNTVRDTFAENLPAGYQEIVLIPKGATYIRIQELGPSRNFLAVRDASGRYYLNGHWTFEITLTDFEAGGTRFEYGKRPASSPTGAITESLYALGPLQSPLYIQMVYQESTPGIEYEYSVPSDVPVPSIWAPADAYQYMLGSYGACSRTCGSGIQIRPVRCVHLKTGEFAPLESCKREILPQLSRSCNQIDCPPAYHKGNWSDCICPGIKSRPVFCEEIRGSGQRLVLEDSECGNQTKPNAFAVCPADDCLEVSDLVPANKTTDDTPMEYKWNTTEWTNCSARCGPGNHSREVTCIDLNGTRVHDSLCPPNERPLAQDICASVPCEGGVDWVTSEWSNCSVPCGSMVATRSVVCAGVDGVIYDDSICGLERKPADRQNCTENPGCDYSWFTSDWSSCSASCGRGVQTRQVLCGMYDDDTIKVDESKCDASIKPITMKTCQAKVPCGPILHYGEWSRCQCGLEKRIVVCLDPSTTKAPVHLTKCNITLDEQIDLSQTGELTANVTSNNNATLTINEAINLNGTLSANETINANETHSTNASINTNETLSVDMTMTSNTTSDGNETIAVSVALKPKPRTHLLENRTCETGGSGSDIPFPVNECCSSQFGCCPEQSTPRNLDYSNCFPELSLNQTVDQVTPASDTTPTQVSEKPAVCLTSPYGCCWDGLRSALGPFKLGCPINCYNTMFGCCSDNKTAKFNETGSNCPPDCLSSQFGCCEDGVTEAGVDQVNCPAKPTTTLPPEVTTTASANETVTTNETSSASSETTQTPTTQPPTTQPSTTQTPTSLPSSTEAVTTTTSNVTDEVEGSGFSNICVEGEGSTCSKTTTSTVPIAV